MQNTGVFIPLPINLLKIILKHLTQYSLPFKRDCIFYQVDHCRVSVQFDKYTGDGNFSWISIRLQQYTVIGFSDAFFWR